tara:strand:- start:757 stop:999 length:243 start_codon:yes stop_codon:yes gene_type:complete
MGKTTLEAISKVFTLEVLDIMLREGLLDYYDIVSSINEDTSWPHPEDVAHNKVILDALVIVIEDFMEPNAYKVWLQERQV